MEGDQIASPSLLPIQPKVQHARGAPLSIVFGKQRLHCDLDQGTAPAPNAGHRASSALAAQSAVYGTLNLLQSSRQVLGADLKLCLQCSRCGAVSAPGPSLYQRAGDLPQRTVEAARRDRPSSKRLALIVRPSPRRRWPRHVRGFFFLREARWLRHALSGCEHVRRFDALQDLRIVQRGAAPPCSHSEGYLAPNIGRQSIFGARSSQD
jgi:hypothetical protein